VSVFWPKRVGWSDGRAVSLFQNVRPGRDHRVYAWQQSPSQPVHSIRVSLKRFTAHPRVALRPVSRYRVEARSMQNPELRS